MNSTESTPRIDQNRCTGCGRCVAACPEHLYSLETSGYRKHAAMSPPEQCTRCMRCLEECPAGAVS